jgi:hypothetical protein
MNRPEGTEKILQQADSLMIKLDSNVSYFSIFSETMGNPVDRCFLDIGQSLSSECELACDVSSGDSRPLQDLALSQSRDVYDR